MQQKLAARALPQMQVDVVENDKGYTLSANLPGVKKSEIAIDVDREAGTIRISAHRIARERSDDERWHRRERFESSVVRTLTLPRNVNYEGIAANLDNGVLCVQLSKQAAGAAAAATSQRIAVQ